MWLRWKRRAAIVDGHEWTAKFEAPHGEPILKVYGDPLTGAEPWTVGLGHCGPDVRQGDTWTRDKCMHAFYNDYAIAQGYAAHVIGLTTWSGLSTARQCVLTDMAFNIGRGRLEGFHNMLDAIRRHNWQMAHDELLDSAYAKQVKGRAIKNADIILKGVFP